MPIHPQVARLTRLPLTAGEMWYLRLLLLHVAPFEADCSDLKCVQGNVFHSFQEAAYAMGIVSHAVGGEALQVITEAIEEMTAPDIIRSLFVIQTFNGFATSQILKVDAIKEWMMSDFSGEADDKFRALLSDLETRLQKMNSCMAIHGLPSGVSEINIPETCRQEIRKWDQHDMKSFVEDPQLRLTSDQKTIVHRVRVVFYEQSKEDNDKSEMSPHIVS